MNERILITGGAGFIGSNLAEELLKLKKEVFVIDDLSTGSKENILDFKENEQFHFFKGSILNKKFLENIIKNNNIDFIFHLAAVVGVKNVLENQLKSLQVNINGTETVLALASKYNIRILLTSSSEIYGKSKRLSFKETDDRILGSIQNSRWSYANSKAIDEFFALAYYKEKKLPVIIVRLFNVTGKKQTGKYGMVIPTFIKQALENKPITVYGTGKQKRCFSDIKDTVEALIKFMNHKNVDGEIFNLGNNEEITINDLAKKIKNITKSKSNIIHLTYKKAYKEGFEDMYRRKPNIKKIQKILNWKPKYDLNESLKQTINFYKQKN